MMKETPKPTGLPEPILVIPCIDPGLSCCRHQLVALNEPGNNVRRCLVFCKSWRTNHSKDGTVYGCKPGTTIPAEIINADEDRLKRIPGYRG